MEVNFFECDACTSVGFFLKQWQSKAWAAILYFNKVKAAIFLVITTWADWKHIGCMGC